MDIERLDITAIRNLSHVRLGELGSINVFHGENGSGKTSLLEAIHLLCLGRSFRSRQFRQVIQHEVDTATVFAAAKDPVSGAKHTLGVSRSRTAAAEIRMNNEPVGSLAELAAVFPLQLLNSESFQLVEGGPGQRRQFLDWGVFHVEHSFNSHWQKARKCIKHRNSLLRHGKIRASELEPWDREIATYGELMDAQRKDYLCEFESVFAPMVERVAGLGQVRIDYRRGWDEEHGLEDVLRAQQDKDGQQGYTGYGPHRADLKLFVGDKPAANVLSRGQEKTLVCSLRLAQAELLRRIQGKSCVFLVDDLPAELDAGHRQRLCAELERLDAQVFVTCIEPKEVEGLWAVPEETRVFHVEHGVVSDCSSGGSLEAIG